MPRVNNIEEPGRVDGKRRWGVNTSQPNDKVKWMVLQGTYEGVGSVWNPMYMTIGRNPYRKILFIEAMPML